MPVGDESRAFGEAGGSHFATTHWSVVLAVGRGDAPDSQRALAALCEAYWYPLYAYVRRWGHSPDDARDLTQGFFATLIEKQYIEAADRERGRFRSFLLTAFKRFCSKERDRADAQKRGGGEKIASLDFAAGESRYSLEPSHEWTAEAIYDRRWALTLLDQVMARLRQAYADAGKTRLFDALKAALAGEAAAPAYSQVAAELGMTEGAVKVAVHRLRQQYREFLRLEVAQTVAGPGEVDGELRLLLAALRGPGR